MFKYFIGLMVIFTLNNVNAEILDENYEKLTYHVKIDALNYELKYTPPENHAGIYYIENKLLAIKDSENCNISDKDSRLYSLGITRVSNKKDDGKIPENLSILLIFNDSTDLDGEVKIINDDSEFCKVFTEYAQKTVWYPTSVKINEKRNLEMPDGSNIEITVSNK